MIYDNRLDFIGAEFQEKLSSFNIVLVPTTVENPQEHFVVKWVHLMMGDCFRMEEVSYEYWEEQVHKVFKLIMWEIHSTLHSLLNNDLRQVSFARKGLMHTRVIVDWKHIKNKHMVTHESLQQ